jgi:hypothetical protein
MRDQNRRRAVLEEGELKFLAASRDAKKTRAALASRTLILSTKEG